MKLYNHRPLLIAALVLFALAFLLAAFLVQQAAAAGCDYTVQLGDTVTLAGRQYTVWRIRTVDGYAIPVSWGETLLYTCALQADPATPQTLVVEVR